MDKFLFDSNSRIMKTRDCIKFYEQDILMSNYTFSTNIQIHITLKYITPGFGLYISDINNSFSIIDYLFKIGNNRFTAYKKENGKQEIVHGESNILKPYIEDKKINLIIDIKEKEIIFRLKDQDNLYPLGAYTIENKLVNYKLGFYSNKYNEIYNIDYLSLMPNNWDYSLANVRAGKVEFINNKFIVENCKKDFEMEQPFIDLEAGKYYLKYDATEINDIYDLEFFIFDSNTLNIDDEDTIHDEEKNILRNDNTFVLDRPTKVSLKLRGTNGIVSNLFITTNPNGSYVETTTEKKYVDASYIKINLNDLKKVEFKAILNNVPEYTDLTKPCPYGIIKTNDFNYSKDDLGISLNKVYIFKYDINSSTLTIFKDDTVVIRKNIPLSIKDENHLTIMYNVNSDVYDLITTDTSDKEENISNKKSFFKFVNADTISPIIVTDNKEESFDLSSSYRIVPTLIDDLIFDNIKFEDTIEITVPNLFSDNVYQVELYGVLNTYDYKKELDVNNLGEDFILIDRNQYTYKNGIVYVDKKNVSQYDYLALKYKKMKNVNYIFTNYEREIFKNKGNVLKLEKPLAKKSQDIVIYGIKEKNNYIVDDMFYYIPNENMINSIDLYTNKYDVIDFNNYEVDLNNNLIILNDQIYKDYDMFVVDYLKLNSYSINKLNETNQYKIDISSEDDDVNMFYDKRNDNNVSNHITTNILPDRNKYLVLRKVDVNEDTP